MNVTMKLFFLAPDAAAAAAFFVSGDIFILTSP
jgi:hypothetical protein